MTHEFPNNFDFNHSHRTNDRIWHPGICWIFRSVRNNCNHSWIHNQPSAHSTGLKRIIRHRVLVTPPHLHYLHSVNINAAIGRASPRTVDLPRECEGIKKGCDGKRERHQASGILVGTCPHGRLVERNESERERARVAATASAMTYPLRRTHLRAKPIAMQRVRGSV